MNSADMKDLVDHLRLVWWMTEGCRNTPTQQIKNNPQDVADLIAELSKDKTPSA